MPYSLQLSVVALLAVLIPGLPGVAAAAGPTNYLPGDDTIALAPETL